jgi:hypothetical protein
MGGDPFGGLRALVPGGLSITSEPQLELELERAARLNYDFLSTSVRLSDAYLRHVIEYGHSIGLAVASPSGLFPAAAFGVDAVEGLRDIGRRGTPTRVSGSNISYRDVIDVIAKSGLTLTPMIGAAVADFVSGFTLKASRDPMTISVHVVGLPAAGVTLTASDSSGFDARVQSLFPTLGDQALRLKPYLVIVSNRSERPIVAYSVFFHMTRADGRWIKHHVHFKYPDAVAGIGSDENPFPSAVDHGGRSRALPGVRADRRKAHAVIA